MLVSGWRTLELTAGKLVLENVYTVGRPIMCRINESTNRIVKRIATNDVHTLSQLHSVWFSVLYYIAMSK